MESTFTDADVSNNLRDIKSEEEGINNTLRSIDASNISQKDKNILKYFKIMFLNQLLIYAVIE